MLDTEHHENLSDFLNNCIRAIKKNHPRLSGLQIAKRLDIPKSTFDRISKLEVSKPSFNYALKIVQEVCGEENVQNFIEKFYPKMLSDLDKVYKGNGNVPFVSQEAAKCFEDPFTYEIMMMATSDSGITREKALEEFGKRGVSVFDSLIAEGILKEHNGKVAVKGPVNANQETVHKFLQNLVKLSYDVDAFGEKDNWLSVQYESVNKEKVMGQIRDVYITANQKVREILNSPESKGNDVVWAGLVMDSLSKNTSNGQRVVQ